MQSAEVKQPPPGFAGPPKFAATKHSSLAYHLDAHPPQPAPVASGGLEEITKYVLDFLKEVLRFYLFVYYLF